MESDGAKRSLISGEDQRTKDDAAALGFAGQWSAETHVEAHAASYMRRSHISEAILVINNRPCPGMMGCDSLLPRLLPANATLTVYGTEGFVKTYDGRKEIPQ